MNKNWIGMLSIAAAGLLVVAVPTPASADCGDSIVFGQVGPTACGGGSCYVTSPGQNTIASIESSFWMFGQGNTATGVGADNGAVADGAGWLAPFGGKFYLVGSWGGGAGYDGCPDTTTPLTTIPNQRMIAQFSDVSTDGQTSFLAIACVRRDPAQGTEFNFSTIGQNIDLKPIPKTAISGSVRVGNEAQITVASPNFDSLVYSDGSTNCNSAALIPQYEVWFKSVNRNAGAPVDRDPAAAAGAWTLGNTCNIGSSCVITSACGAVNCDVYVGVSPRYASGFGTGDNTASPRLSPNSTLVQAGPTLATPPDFKIVPKKPAPTRQIKK